MQPVRDGFLSFKGYKTYYKIVGNQKTSNKIPLLIIAGGPGSPHNYLLDLQQLTDTGRQVIFYDQLGSGKSDIPKDESLYIVQTYIDEINELRNKLRLDKIHILGHSWGGMLAIDYLLTKPKGVESLVLASTIISIPLFKEEMKKLRKKLPREINKALKKYESNGSVDDPEYKEAYAVFNKKHIFLGDYWPPHLNAPVNSFGTDVYRKMWGLSETYPNGSLSNWDRITELIQIHIPTLITTGRFDEVTPRQANITKKNIKDSVQVFFEHSGHMPHVDEPSLYKDVLEEFLKK